MDAVAVGARGEDVVPCRTTLRQGKGMIQNVDYTHRDSCAAAAAAAAAATVAAAVAAAVAVVVVTVSVVVAAAAAAAYAGKNTFAYPCSYK